MHRKVGRPLMMTDDLLIGALRNCPGVCLYKIEINRRHEGEMKYGASVYSGNRTPVQIYDRSACCGRSLKWAGRTRCCHLVITPARQMTSMVLECGFATSSLPGHGNRSLCAATPSVQSRGSTSEPPATRLQSVGNEKGDVKEHEPR